MQGRSVHSEFDIVGDGVSYLLYHSTSSDVTDEELFSKSSVMNLCVFVEEEMMVVEAERNISLDLHPPGLADHIA